MQPRIGKLFFLLSMAVTIGLLLLSCAPAAPPIPTPTKGPAAAAPTPVSVMPTPAPSEEKPRYGGTLRITETGDAPSYDPHQESTIRTLAQVAPIFNGIVRYGPEDNSKVVGDLAEKWEVSPDGLTFTFYFPKGVKWHDGKPFTAEDARFTLDRIRRPPKGMLSLRRDLFHGIKSVDAVDDTTLRITLEYPRASLIPVLAMGWNLVVPKHLVEPLEGKKISTREAIGTGPYVFKEYTRGVQEVLTKNPNYFIPGRPYVDGVVLFVILDPAAMTSALRTGQLHIIGGAGIVPPEAAIVRKADPNIKLIKFKNLGFPHIGVNTQRKPFDDIRVRKAIFLALDRQAANQVLMNSEALIGGPLSAGSYWSLPEEEILKTPGYRQPKDQDLAEAKRLLAEAGYPDGFDTEIKTWGIKLNTDLAVFYIDQMRRINIRAKMRYMETAAFYAAADKGDFDTFAWAQAIAIEDPDQMFGEHYITGASRNYGRYVIPGFDELYIKQSRTMDPEERRKLVWQMQRMIMEHYLKAIAFWRSDYIAIRPEARGYHEPVGIYNNLRYQDVWLTK